ETRPSDEALTDIASLDVPTPTEPNSSEDGSTVKPRADLLLTTATALDADCATTTSSAPSLSTSVTTTASGAPATAYGLPAAAVNVPSASARRTSAELAVAEAATRSVSPSPFMSPVVIAS